ncbi:serine hydrolase domain-containing protein [Pseudonocardia abyssalis]|uniref:Beta-lactamase family protein n=1 Tax=Pseudonocardia abyssalis TaxID=2792008 RepID=A0ABS6UWE1_9PSEU|nr:serine hydrolase domain-containing protein [Pseudonocardia abyssalis]MBW0118308.1 beta-lactamase family protein [Pseudonocardia abyssalis]MBW0136554.1 beta-lactamase family protein [Pseudonocardia abyssalis]
MTTTPDLSPLSRHVDSGEIPGLVALVAHDDEVRVATFGRLHHDGPPVERDSIFRISSMTKPVVAAAAMLLIGDGLLDLDEPVDRLLPELADRRVLRSVDADLDDTVPAHRAITVRDLLTFRLGFGLVLAPPGQHPIQRAVDDLSLAQGAPGTQTPPAPDEWIRRFATLPLLHQPGERWMYGTGSDVLGVLLARAAGSSLPDLLRDRILAPLGMRDTGFHVPATEVHRLATMYRPGGVVSDDPATGAWSRPPAFAQGAGGLVSTVDDYLAFSEALRTGDLLPPAVVAEMTRDQLDPGQADGVLLPEGFGWGFGVAVRTDGRYGWEGGLGTSWSTHPGTRVTGILLTQVEWSQGPTEVWSDFWRIVEG